MREVVRQVKELSLGDLIRVEWYDASIGKSLSGGLNGIDVPVTSWGVFLGVLGAKNKHIILAQNSFHYSDGLYDIDYTAIPTAWTTNITAIIRNHVPPETAKQLLNSFLIGGKTSIKRNKRQKKRCETTKDWIRQALTKTIQPKGKHKPITIEPNPKLVYAVKFAITMTLSLTTLEITHITILHTWNSEIFAAITGLTGTITGILIATK
jgi:hypothetical protein